MSDTIGRITVPDIAASGSFPLVADYPFGRAEAFTVATHTFGSANAKIEQRFLLGSPARRYTFQKALTYADRAALKTFWEARKGAYEPFSYDVPNADGTTTATTVIFENAPLSLQQLTNAIATVGITFVEIPDPESAPAYPLDSTVTRFPSAALATALLDQAQELVPLVRIRVAEAPVDDIYLSDRRCTVGAQLYLPRLLEIPEVGQSLVTGAQGQSASDDVRFVFGNADGVMMSLANDTELQYARIEFSLYHVGTGIKIDLWAGEITDWARDGDGSQFVVTSSDGIHDVTLPYPSRRVSRFCWKTFKDGVTCPYVGADTSCDKGFSTSNGCQAHGMDSYFGGIECQPQGVGLRSDYRLGSWTISRKITNTSQVADTIYGQALPDIWHSDDGDVKKALPVNCLLASGREEDQYYDALGIVGAGPLGAYTAPQNVDWDGDGTAEKFVGHTLDGQPHHGFGTDHPSYGLRTSLGADPNTDEFRLTESRGSGPERAAGTAFLEIRRTDQKGIQPTRITDHSMQAMVSTGLSGFEWNSGVRSSGPGLTNVIWVAINTLIRAKGLLNATQSAQEALFDVDAAETYGAICADVVSQIIGSGTETQYRYKGVIGDTKPLRDWISDILTCALGYYTWAFGKLKVGLRCNASVVEAFTTGNILLNSLRLSPLKPSFEKLVAHFADEEYQFAQNTL
ncbi:MAG: hypothetical protein M1541_00710, partial [Acidobacteria bacterium]|nr:hypothetical protein [Acidobacteriota bacterium]